MLLLPATTKFRTHKKTIKVTKPNKVWQSSKSILLESIHVTIQGQDPLAFPPKNNLRRFLTGIEFVLDDILK